MPNKGKYYQELNETNISGLYSLDLKKQNDFWGNIELTGDTELTLQEDGLSYKQNVILIIKFNGAGISFTLNKNKFLTVEGLQPILDNENLAINFLEFKYDYDFEKAFIVGLQTGIKAIP